MHVGLVGLGLVFVRKSERGPVSERDKWGIRFSKKWSRCTAEESNERGEERRATKNVTEKSAKGEEKERKKERKKKQARRIPSPNHVQNAVKLTLKFKSPTCAGPTSRSVSLVVVVVGIYHRVPCSS